MESEVNGQVLSVTGRTVGQNKTIFDIAFSDGNTYSTFDGQLANRAQQLVNQPITARVKVEQKGQYTNFYFNEIVGDAQPTVTASTIPLAPATSPPSRGGYKKDPETEARITRMNVLGTAHDFIGNLFQGAGPEALAEAKELAHEYAQKLYEAVTGTHDPLGGAVSPSNSTGGSTPTPTTPEPVATAAGVTGPQGDGIPW